MDHVRKRLSPLSHGKGGVWTVQDERKDEVGKVDSQFDFITSM